MKASSLKIKSIWVVVLLALVVAVAGCTEKLGSDETSSTTQEKKTETIPQEIAAPSSNIPGEEFKTYSSVHYNIDYPVSWTAPNFEDDIVSFGSGPSDLEDEFAESLGVLVDIENESVNLDQVISLSLVELKKGFINFVLLENSKITLANQSARKIVYTYERDKVGLVKTVQIISIKNSKNRSKSYIITYVGQGDDFDTYWPYAQKMVDSFVMK